MSESKRMEDNYNSPTKNCGSYEYKSFIGEGPKYTIRQKFNLDGTLDIKKPPGAPVYPPIPGPGHYQISRNLGGLKYTFGERRGKKEKKGGESQESPPVGSYELRKDDSLRVPSVLFDKEVRKNLNINETALKYPGPGKYDINYDQTISVGPKWSFGQCERIIKLRPKNPHLKRLNVPGPGSYSMCDITGNEGPHYSFTKEKFNHSDSADESMMKKIKDYPSPNSYNKKLDYVPNSPFYSIPKMGRKEIGVKFKNSCPGPGKYEPLKEKSSGLKRSPSWVISKSNRDEEAKVDGSKKVKVINPGPGTYNIKLGNFGQGPKYTISKMNRRYKIIDAPGPGAYNINNYDRPNEPSYSIGHSTREDVIERIKKENFPGPGKYKINDVELCKSISFPRNERIFQLKSNVPGPGFYKIPTSFNNVSSVTRSGGAFDPSFRYV